MVLTKFGKHLSTIFGIIIGVLFVCSILSTAMFFVYKAIHFDPIEKHGKVTSIVLEKEFGEFQDYRVFLKDVSFIWQIKTSVPFKSKGWVGPYPTVYAYDKDSNEYRFDPVEVESLLPDSLKPYQLRNRYDHF